MKSAQIKPLSVASEPQFAVGQPVYISGLPGVWLVSELSYSTIMYAWIYTLVSKDSGNKKRSEIFLTPARFASPPLVEVI